DDWTLNRSAGFVLLADASDKAQLEEKLPAFLNKYIADSPESVEWMYLLPLLDVRLKSEHITSFLRASPRESVYINFALGTLLLLVVSINFVNLSTARHMNRAKEIGIRKVVGARRIQLIRQFLVESVLLSFLAIPLAIMFFEIIQGYYTSLLQQNIAPIMDVSSVSNSIWNYPFLLKYLIVAALLTGLFSGIYPAFYLSAFQPVKVLQGAVHAGKKMSRIRKTMIVSQFALSIFFIVCAGIMSDQFDYLLKADFGYNRERIAVIQLT
ncbi:unnamed protein product, partial [marine sediment metagenome]